MLKNKLIVFLVIVVMVAGGMILFKGRGDSVATPTPQETVKTQSGEVEVNGEIACLPYIIAVSGNECVKGIKGDDGKVYALDSLKVGSKELTMKEGTKVKAIGSYQAANTSVDDSKVFKYDGVLVLRVLEQK